LQNTYLIHPAKKIVLLFALLLVCAAAYCQPKTDNAHNFSLVVVNEKLQPAEGATVKLLRDNQLVKTVVTNANGIASFVSIQRGAYTFLVSSTGYKPQTSRVYHFPADVTVDTIKLQPLTTNLQQVDVTAHAPVIEMKQGKKVVNVDASVTNAGSTVLEVLEKSPGVTVDRNLFAGQGWCAGNY
jgi:iron complex outermembrane receptor protein